ncbi:hypothetical protein [Streptomyces sp. NRRL S-813]|uniref:hypothetical protein n=1 Tax=Streptomyces sp. NRRL S-813 TaxID=1463919 RepID=UPI0004C17FC8|nr:hypothetical protein [Streptomyces sp. NRRL S-813]
MNLVASGIQVFFEYRGWDPPASYSHFRRRTPIGFLQLGEEDVQSDDQSEAGLRRRLEEVGVIGEGALDDEGFNCEGVLALAVVLDHYGLPKPPFAT